MNWDACMASIIFMQRALGWNEQESVSWHARACRHGSISVIHVYIQNHYARKSIRLGTHKMPPAASQFHRFPRPRPLDCIDLCRTPTPHRPYVFPFFFFFYNSHLLDCERPNHQYFTLLPPNQII